MWRWCWRCRGHDRDSQRRQRMALSGPLAFILPRLQFPAGRRAVFVNGTTDNLADVTEQGRAARCWLISTLDATVYRRQLFDEMFRQPVRVGVGPVKRDAKGGATSATGNTGSVDVGVTHDRC